MWTNGQAQSERLSAQILLQENFTNLDPSHPLGGRDGTKDAICYRGNKKWVMAVYFPRNQKSFKEIKDKFIEDCNGVISNSANGIAFVSNQELRLSQRSELEQLVSFPVEIYHLERVTTILDQPIMAAVRKQYLDIDVPEGSVQSAIEAIKSEIEAKHRRLEGLQTGGDTFCYWMLYDFDIETNIGRQYVVIRKGEFPLYDVRFRILDMETNQQVDTQVWGEINCPADFKFCKWELPESVYYRVFFHARNGAWNQDLILKKSNETGCWLAATRVVNKNGTEEFYHIDNPQFEKEFGEPQWK